MKLLCRYKVITTDDLCVSNLQYFKYWDRVKEVNPQLKLTVFVIANHKKKGSIDKSPEFLEWFEKTRDWVKVGVHGYDHEYPPEQERNNARNLVKKSLEILKPFLPERFLYRPPGHQRTIYTEPSLKTLGFKGIAYRSRIKMFDTGEIIEPIFNSHLTEDTFENPIGGIWKTLIKAR